MDIQLKRGVLDVCVLSAIRERDSYGYQIIKDLSPCVRLSESTLYTILKRLEAAGLLTVRSAEHNGRLWTSGRSLWRSTASFPERRRLRTNREEFFASLRQRLDRQRPAQRPQRRDAHGRDDHRRSESARRRRRGGAQRAHHDRRHPARARRRRLARNRRDHRRRYRHALLGEALCRPYRHRRRLRPRNRLRRRLRDRDLDRGRSYRARVKKPRTPIRASAVLRLKKQRKAEKFARNAMVFPEKIW